MSFTQHTKSSSSPRPQQIDRVKVLRPILHRGHFGEVLSSQPLGLVLKKLNPAQQKQAKRQLK